MSTQIGLGRDPHDTSSWVTAQRSYPQHAQGLALLEHVLGDELGRYIPRAALHAQTGILQRTMAGRLADTHAVLADAGRGLLARFGIADTPRTFVDVGPGVGNPTTPAQTSLEVAQAFPAIDVVAVDLPQAVDEFNRHADSPQHKLVKQHVTIVPGEAAWRSLREILPRRAFWHNSPLAFRFANSVDIYERWTVSEMMLRNLGRDVAAWPVLAFFNRGILAKRAGQASWQLIGELSMRGFNHSSRILVPYGPGFAPPYRFVA